jgi:hypothetical protein
LAAQVCKSQHGFGQVIGGADLQRVHTGTHQSLANRLFAALCRGFEAASKGVVLGIDLDLLT